MHVDVCSSMSDHMFLCVCICARCVCVYVCLWVHVPCCVKTVTVYSPSPLLAPGMIINPIIKHLLPTAPAFFFSPGTPGTPSHHSKKLGDRKRERGGGRGREGGLEREREGGTQAAKEGGVKKRAANPTGHQIEARFFHTGAVYFVWWQTPCEVMWFQNKRRAGGNNPMCSEEEKKRKGRIEWYPTTWQPSEPDS